MEAYKSVTEYLKHTPKELLPKVKEMRSLVMELVPEGKEVIRYGMPTIQLEGKNFIHYAAMKGHLGFYPSPSGIQPFEEELRKKGIDFSKGCIRLSYSKPLPVALISKIIKFRLKEEKTKRNI